MPPADPYSTPRARIVDFLLCLLAIVLILIVIATAPAHRAEQAEDRHNSQVGQMSSH